MPFGGLAPVRFLRPSMAVLYHLIMNGKLQRAYWSIACRQHDVRLGNFTTEPRFVTKFFAFPLFVRE